MAQCLLYHGWLVLLKTGACCGLPIFFEVTTNWRAGCQKLACPVRREGRPESSSLPLSRHTPTRRYVSPPRPRWRYFDRSVPESAHLCSQNLGKDPHPVFVLCKSNLPLEGVLLLIMSYWTCDAGLRGSASLAAILDSLSS